MLKYLFKNYVNPFKWRFVFGGILLVISSIMPVILPRILMEAVNNAIETGRENNLLEYALIYLACFIVFVLSSFFMAYILENLGQDILIKLKTTSFYRVLNWDYHQFTKYSPGKLVTRIEGDAEKVRFFFTFALIAIIKSLLMFLGMIFMMLSINIKLTMVVLAPMPFVIIFLILLQKFVYPKFKKVRAIMADIISKTTEYLRGLNILKAYTKEELYMDKYNDRNKEKYKTERNNEIALIVFFNFVMLSSNLIIAFIFKIGAPMLVKGLLTYGAVVMLINYAKQIFLPIRKLSGQITRIQRSIASFSRIYELHTKEVKIKSGDKIIENIEDKIEFKNVNFAYKEDEPVLKGINLKIPVGEKWALVGETGSGKSTLIKLLLRFYDVDDGKILFDGINIKDINIKSLRKDISLIEQDFYLFPASVIDNIRLFDDSIDEGYVKKICKKINIHEFISNLPKGYHTHIMEEGNNLSVGEKQLLSIARAMVKESDIVLLDEATSSIDPHTEEMIDEAMNILLEDKTSLIVAHRLNTIIDADKIIVLHDGKIHRIGTHKELYNKEGFYYNLCQNQFIDESSG